MVSYLLIFSLQQKNDNSFVKLVIGQANYHI